ncbi:MAG: hypothetical protein RL173_864 [Fibrobacterota bacterium]
MSGNLSESSAYLTVPSSLVRMSILGVDIHSGPVNSILESMERLSQHSNSAYVNFVNVHMVMEARRDPKFAEIVNRADLNCPDGLPIAKSIGWFYAIRQRQVAGPDTLPLLLLIAHQTRKKVFVLGSTPEVLRAFELRAIDQFGPEILCGTYSPPFRELTQEEDDALVDRINSSKADMIFVALGCPKQERWMAAHKGRVQGCMFGLGYAIPVYAGRASRAPRWMIERGLEWLFRLSSDPRRLFVRYAKTNSAFLISVFRELSQRKNRRPPRTAI